MDKLLENARQALSSLDESRSQYSEACEREERTGQMDPDAYEAWEDSVMDIHIGEVSDALAALVEELS